MSEKVYFEIAGASRYKRLSCAVYYPNSCPKAIVNIVHSVYEHSEIYSELMKFLCENGYAAVCHDMAGHGRTAKERFELGFFSDVQGHSQIIEDIRKVMLAGEDKGKARYNTDRVPAVLLGHSTGSFAARLAAVQYPGEISALILSGTAGRDRFERLRLWFANQMIQLKGERGHSKLLKAVTESKLLGDSPYDWYSSDKEEVRRFSSDPLCTFPLTISAAFDLLLLKSMATKKEWYSSLDRNISVLLLSGKEDRFSSMGEGAKETMEKLQKAGHMDNTLKLYDGVRNQIFKDVKREEAFRDILEFLNNLYQE